MDGCITGAEVTAVGAELDMYDGESHDDLGERTAIAEEAVVVLS